MKKSLPRASSSSIEFPYAIRRSGERWIYLPIVEAEIPTAYEVYPVRLLLDSGADCSMLPRYLGEAAGLDFRKLPRTTVKGIEGHGVHAYKGTLRLRIGQWLLPPIPCMYADSDRTPLLLGREGFFELVNITFDNRGRRVVLTKLQ